MAVSARRPIAASNSQGEERRGLRIALRNQLLLSGGSMVRTCNLQPATRPGMNCQREAVQLNDRSHEIEAKAHAWRASDLVGPVETAQHGLALLIADAGAGIADAHDGFIFAADQFNVDPAAFRRKLDGIVDEVGDRLEEEIPIAAYAQLLLHPDPQLDTLGFGNRFVDIAYLLQHFVQQDGAKSRGPPAVFDFGQTQQRRDDRQRLVNICDRPVYGRLQLFQRSCVGVAALQRQPRPRQRRSQIVGDVVTYTSERVDHRFHFIEHAIDDDREPRKRIVHVAVWESLAQIAGDDALDPLIYLLA